MQGRRSGSTSCWLPALPIQRVQKLMHETGLARRRVQIAHNRGVRLMASLDSYHWTAGEPAMVTCAISAGPGSKRCGKTAVFQITERDGSARLVAVPCAFRQAVTLERALRETCAGSPHVAFIGRFEGIVLHANLGEFLESVRLGMDSRGKDGRP